MNQVHIIDSHTGGEPTRVVIAGGPDLGIGPVDRRRDRFRHHHDDFRRAVVCEPRGSDVVVGALLGEPSDPSKLASVIFFNNVGYLGMCVHGTIGVARTLHHLGRIDVGEYTLETPVGDVTIIRHRDGRVSVRNVPSYRYRAAVVIEVPGIGAVTGDIAWGGNWFFLIADDGQRIDPSNVADLTDFTRRVREALDRSGVTGAEGGLIDHIELFGPPTRADVADSRNFVLCPGGVYDRSSCGTGTSAKLACLAADGELVPGQIWRQQSIIGSVFEGSYQPLADGRIVPTITAKAYLTAEATLHFDPDDPFRTGIPI